LSPEGRPDVVARLELRAALRLSPSCELPGGDCACNIPPGDEGILSITGDPLGMVA
jgi:hypothetical protein